MKHTRLSGTWLGVWALWLAACTQWPTSQRNSGDVQSNAGTCSHLQPAEGCACTEGAAERCFLPDTPLPNDQVLCSEGTRVCRGGRWSGCEQAREYVADVRANQQALVDTTRGDQPCSVCDILCFRVTDPLTVAGGTADGSVQFGPGGGLQLLPGVSDGGAGDGGGDAGTVTQCETLNQCCYRLSGALRQACDEHANAGVESVCTSDLNAYCAAAVISGPPAGCTPGQGIDTDCDGIPNPVDAVDGPPFPGVENQAIFHELYKGASGSNAINIAFELNSADVYILFDTTGTMGPARENLSSLLTSGNVVDCAELAQCCASDTTGTCKAIAATGVATDCYAKQMTYCLEQRRCADTDGNDLPNEEWAERGVLGGIRCLIGNAKFGLGRFREVPVHKEPEEIPCFGEGHRYGDRDEQLFRHLVDMTSDHDRIGNALDTITMNYNWDEPEGGFLALNSIVTGRGHYFGINRPAVADRSSGVDCPSDTFGYPCFRKAAVPVVLMFTDAPHHNGPTDSSNCGNRGAGCPYSALGTTSSSPYTSSGNDAASDLVAHYVSAKAEDADSAYDIGDVRNTYLTLVGDTTYMTGNSRYTSNISGCATEAGAPDTVIRFDVSGSTAANINIHLTKNDVYPRESYLLKTYSPYGEWEPWSHDNGTDDPSPATEFGAVVALFKGNPDAVTSARCKSDAQPATVRGTDWPERSVDFTESLNPGTYYVVIKGATASSFGQYQLQIGNASAKVKTVYTPPLWTDTRDALISSGVRVIPVLPTAGLSSGTFLPAAKAQAEALAKASGAVRSSDGSAIWYEVEQDGKQTGQMVVNSIADLAENLAMDVTVVAVDGPHSSSLFPMTVTPKNSTGCKQHPLIASGVCTDSSPIYDCDTQYACRPGSKPLFQVTFTNPSSMPVPRNPSDMYGGYLFKLQLRSNDSIVLQEIPVYLIPNEITAPAPPSDFSATGVYEQQVTARSCAPLSTSSDAGTMLPDASSEVLDASIITLLDGSIITTYASALLAGGAGGTSGTPLDAGPRPGGPANSLPSWRDLYFKADLPEGTSIDFQMCTASSKDELADCTWSSRAKITVTGTKGCATDNDCSNVPGYGFGVCSSSRVCQFVNPAKVWPDTSCTSDTQCPNGPLGSGDYIIKSRCETRTGMPNFGRCIARSVPLDVKALITSEEDGRNYSKLHMTLRANPLLDKSPQLYSWELTYACYSAF